MADWSMASILPMVGASAVALLGAGATFQQLADKPAREEVRQAIDNAATALESEHAKFEALIPRMDRVEAQQERGGDVQEVLLLQADWQSDVLEHIASKRRGKPPSQPDELKAKRRELMR